jgi:CBS domain-containing protein
MFVRDVMRENSVVCTEDMPLAKVYQLMLENGCDYITVVESYAHRIPIGIITEHDICLQVIGKGRDPRSLNAANVMNTNVIKASYKLSLADCSNLMETNQMKRALVVNEDGMLCGILTEFDLENTKTKQQIENLLSAEAVSKYNTHRLNRLY